LAKSDGRRLNQCHFHVDENKENRRKGISTISTSSSSQNRTIQQSESKTRNKKQSSSAPSTADSDRGSDNTNDEVLTQRNKAIVAQAKEILDELLSSGDTSWLNDPHSDAATKTTAPGTNDGSGKYAA
jgi:hypothetical protein